jgi:hypothetical protein
VDGISHSHSCENLRFTGVLQCMYCLLALSVTDDEKYRYRDLVLQRTHLETVHSELESSIPYFVSIMEMYTHILLNIYLPGIS